MICSTCKKESSRILYVNGREICHNCGTMTEAGGTPTKDILTRSSFRITQDRLKHEGDIQTPYIFDKAERKVKPNEEFAKLYPDRIEETYSRDEIEKIKK